MNYIKDKVVIITGAGSGFGQLASEKIAAMGGKVVLADINEENAGETVDKIRKNSGTAEYIVTDVSNKEQVNAMARFAIEKFGRIDVLVNNAGIMPNGRYSTHAIEAWEKCIDINQKGVLYGILAVYDQMIRQKSGHIVNVSSVYATGITEGSGVYSGTKIAVARMSDALRRETRGIIKVSTVYPSAAATKLGDTVVDQETALSFFGANTGEILKAMESDPVKLSDPRSDDPGMLILNADAVADNIVYCINQPPGIVISDITIRPANDPGAL